MEPVFQRYESVLQNIETVTIATYREHPDLVDLDVTRVTNVLVDEYRAEASGRKPREVRLTDLQTLLHRRLHKVCEWSLGRGERPHNIAVPTDSIAQSDLILCLKKILSSIKFWSKRAGRRGYLDFVSQYV